MKVLYLFLFLLFWVISCENNSIDNCEDSCQYEGKLACSSNNYITSCSIDSNGCLVPIEVKDCTEDFLCSNGECGCKDGFHYEDNICVSNQKDVNCTNNDEITPNNMESTVENTTIKWDTSTESWDTSSCNWKCIDNYKEKNGKCISDCTEFEIINNNQCECKNGYKEENGKCIYLCNDNLKVPNEENNGCRCIDYYILKDNKCIFECKEILHEVVNNDNDDCDCMGGYHKENNHCVRDSLNNGLLLHYKFEDNIDNSKNDEIGENNNITYVDGVVGNAVSFNGIDSYIKIGTSEDLRGDSFSAQIWVKNNSVSTDAILSCTTPKGFYGWEFLTHYNDKNMLFNFLSSDGNNLFSIDSDYNISDNQWHLITFTVDGDRNYFKIYIDTNLKDRVDISGINRPYDSGVFFYLGASKPEFLNAPHYFYNGLLDEFRFYNRVLNISEIVDLYGIRN